MEANLETDFLQSEKTKVVYQQEKLVKKIDALTDFCGWPREGNSLNVKVLRVVSNYSCESRIIWALINKEFNRNTRFDPYYRQKSEFATTKILDHVKTILSANKIEASILTEVDSNVGRYDAIVALGDINKALLGDSGKIKIEIKASSGLDLEQIARYMWDPFPIILVRVITGQVAKIMPSELFPYVTFSLEELTAKVDRLLSKNYYIVPGMDCVGCLVYTCMYCHKKAPKANFKNLVALPDIDFADDLTSFFKNLSYVAEKTAIIVVEELKNISEKPDRNNLLISA